MSKGTITGGGEKGLYDVSIERKDGTPLISPAHCADLTEDLSGSVGVLEIAGDLDKGFNIQPGHDGNAAYDPARDGEMKQVQPFPKTSPTGEVYWNWAMRPGWQKWKPNYRYGVISNINTDADTCDVALDACYATDTPDGKSLDINQSESLTGVTIEYMDCDSVAFSDGDRVIVKFENNNWGSPKVIGFESEPRGCQWEPWETPGLCETHDWKLYTPVGGNRMCPPLPIHEVQTLGSTFDMSLSETDGLVCSQTSAKYGYHDRFSFIWINSASDKIITNVNTVRLKLLTTLANFEFPGSWDANFGILYLYFNAAYSSWVAFVFASSDPSGVVAPYHYIGDNCGEEIVIDLTDYGIAPDQSVYAVAVDVNVGYPATIAFNLNYIGIQ